MSASRNPQRREEILVPEGCPQCPGGGYELISGARREFLLTQVNEALGVFRVNPAVDELLQALHDAVVKGLSVPDLDRGVSSAELGSLFIGCREIGSENGEARVEISVIDHDRRYVVEVCESQISPITEFSMNSCPLLGSEEQAGCIPETCQVVLQARAMTSKRA